MDDASDRGEPRAPELEDLLKLCSALGREKVRYVLIGGFAVILHGWVRATKDIDLLVDVSVSNIRALKQALSVLPDNAAALVGDGEVGKYPVVRVADEIIVDLMHKACGIDYAAAVESGVEAIVIEGVEITLASKELLIRTKQTVRESDVMDVNFLRMRIVEEADRKVGDESPRDLEERPQAPRSALIAGATGLIGGFLLEMLLEEPLYRQVHALVRRPLDRRHQKLIPVVTDFDRLNDSPGQTDAFHVDDVFCCLGTTIKTAGTQEAFRKVDLEYVVTLARLARAAGARRFFLVSTIGADPGSSNSYLHVKGATESAVAACGYPALHLFRPSILSGRRQESRPGERIGLFVMRLLTPFLVGPLRRFRPVQARTVAAAMVGAARVGRRGRQLYTFDDIVGLAHAAKEPVTP